MQRFRDRYKAARSQPGRGGSAMADGEAFPMLSEALCGVPSPQGDSWEVPPASLTIWFEGSQAKFCLGAQFDPIKTFGTFESLSGGLDAVEKALQEGKCETKRTTGQKAR